ncbi:MAG: ABC transporter permease [Elusimicrobia bacterium]|nr:ABC transporter permease [Elusimicrobiota bacterium]
MNLWEALRTAWLEISSNKMRSFLSFFAITIGTAAILYTFAQIRGMHKMIDENLLLMGPGRIYIEKKENYVSKGLSPGLTSDDAEEIRRTMPELYMVNPLVRGYGQHFRFQDYHNEDLLATGITEEWVKRDWVYRQRGRFINSEDVRQGARVCVIVQPGGWVEKPWWAKYFHDSDFGDMLKRRDLLGQTVKLGDHLFTVVGIIKEPPRDKDPRWETNSYGGSGTILVPITTYQRTLSFQSRQSVVRHVNRVEIDTGDEKTIPLYKRRIDEFIKARHRGEVDYDIKDNREDIQGILNQIHQYVVAILAIGIVAILAGGIGIMNVTLATIYSRIKEIGIRRAVGATRGDIMMQFLVEAMALGLMGGIAGLGLGAGGVMYLSRHAERDMYSMAPSHFLFTVLIAVGTGFVFALYPASQASKLDPVEALHYE